MADIEEELETHVIRKSTLDNRELKIKRNTIVPLLICDINAAKTTNGELFSVFNRNFDVKRCLVSGRIMGFVSQNELCNTYLLEDGTAVIELSVFKSSGDRNKLTLAKIKSHSIRFYYKPELMGALHQMLQSADIILDAAKIIIGTVLIVLGRISLFRGKITIVGQNLFVHKGQNRDMEIAFKDYLRQCYDVEKFPFLPKRTILET